LLDASPKADESDEIEYRSGQKTAFESKGPQPPESNRATRAVRVIKQSKKKIAESKPHAARGIKLFAALRAESKKGPPGGYFCAVFRPGIAAGDKPCY